MSFSISGKTAIVTGAANGIGLAIGRQFAREGANVMFVDHDEAALLQELGSDVEDGNIRHFAGDLRERLTIANLLSATIDAFDQILQRFRKKQKLSRDTTMLSSKPSIFTYTKPALIRENQHFLHQNSLFIIRH